MSNPWQQFKKLVGEEKFKIGEVLDIKNGRSKIKTSSDEIFFAWGTQVPVGEIAVVRNGFVETSGAYLHTDPPTVLYV